MTAEFWYVLSGLFGFLIGMLLIVLVNRRKRKSIDGIIRVVMKDDEEGSVYIGIGFNNQNDIFVRDQLTLKVVREKEMR